jgi:hypothetical protein
MGLQLRARSKNQAKKIIISKCNNPIWTRSQLNNTDRWRRRSEVTVRHCKFGRAKSMMPPKILASRSRLIESSK